jgi:hypothetical protein
MDEGRPCESVAHPLDPDLMYWVTYYKHHRNRIDYWPKYILMIKKLNHETRNVLPKLQHAPG